MRKINAISGASLFLLFNWIAEMIDLTHFQLLNGGFEMMNNCQGHFFFN
jgi:hypothetical protein